MKKNIFHTLLWGTLIATTTLLWSSCSKQELIVPTVPDTYTVNINGISLGDSLKLIFEGQEVARGSLKNRNKIEFLNKELLFKKGVERKFEIRTADSKDSLIVAFSPNFETKEDFNYQFLYATEMGGLVTGLSMPEPAKGMMNFKVQFTTPLSKFNEPVDLVFEYSETDPNTWEQKITYLTTIKNYVPNSGFIDTPIEVRPPKMGEDPYMAGEIIQLEYLEVKIYKAGTEEFYHSRISSSKTLRNPLKEGEQEWIVLTEKGRDASRLSFDAKYLSQYFAQ